MAEEKKPTQQNQIQIKDTIPGAEYANLLNVVSGKEEFVMMFANVVAGSGRVVGKIMTSPGHLKRIIKALEHSLKQYEDKYGNVDIAESPKDEIGFQARD